MKTAIVDTKTTGHHLEYIYGLCSELEKKGYDGKYDIYCDQKLFKYISENKLPNIDDNNTAEIKTGELKHPEGNWIKITKTAFNNLEMLSRYDEIIFLTFNLYFVALIFYAVFMEPKFSISGIYFDPHARKDRDIKNWLRDITIRLLIKKYKCRIFILNDSLAVKKLNDKYSTNSFEVIVDPIPTFYYSDCEESNSINDTNVLTFTMIGSISKRKGVFKFLEALKSSGCNCNFVIAGRIKDDILEKILGKIQNLKQSGINVSVHNEFLTNREFAEYIVNSDVLVLPYLTKGASSGILGHAAYNKIPVIGPNKGLLGKLIGQYNLGIRINPTSKDKFSEALKNKKIFEAWDRTGMKRYTEKNSIGKFVSTLLFRIL